MNLKKIEAYGFKSFSDKLEMEFEHEVTGVVGPNGCGKSNVVDAIRWVLGEQSAKALRGKSMQDLIFNGTEKRKSMSYCEVSMFLDNKSRLFPIDMDDISVSRKLYRSNESEYYLNKNLVRLKDITDLLQDAGLGREGYSIIGQGRMDAILNAKPDERRAIFEEALGISKFRSRKVDTERKLAKTRDNMARLYDIISELERQLNPLKKQAADATKYLALQKDLRYHEINTYIYSYDNASDRKNAVKEVISDVEGKLATATESYNEAFEKYEKLFGQMTDIDSLISGLRNQQLQLSIKLERQTGEARLLNEKVNNLRNNNSASEEAIAQLRDAIEQNKRKSEDTSITLQSQRLELEVLSRTATSLNDKFYDCSNKLVGYNEQLERAQKQVMSILDQLSTQKSQLASLTSERGSCNNRINNIDRDVNEIDSRIKAMASEQGKDIVALLESNIDKITAEKMANDVDKYLSNINGILSRVYLDEQLKSKVSSMIGDLSEKSKKQLRAESSFEQENWQQNLILLSALSERFSKYGAIYDNQMVNKNKLLAERESLETKLKAIEGNIKVLNETIDYLNEKRESASDQVYEYQQSYNEVKGEKEAVQEEITTNKLKIAGLNSNISSNDAIINSCKQGIVRINGDIATRAHQIEQNKLIIEQLYEQIAKCGGNSEDTELLNAINERLSNAGTLKGDLQKQFTEADRDRQFYSAEVAQLTERKTKEEYNLMRIDDDINALQERILTEYEVTYSSAMREKDENYDFEQGKDAIVKLRTSIARLGYININAVADYEETQKRYDDINGQMDDMKKAEADLTNILKELTREIVIRFNDGFEIINLNFGQVFKELFAGGHARLTIDKDEEKSELEYGIEIEAQPPGKKLQNISLLSGGERTLTAAAVLFAILKLRPMPFCVLDEIEAALDDANAERIANYIKKFSCDTQFIVITHKKPTMEACDVLYGVTMEEKGVSKVVSVQLTDAVESAAS